MSSRNRLASVSAIPLLLCIVQVASAHEVAAHAIVSDRALQLAARMQDFLSDIKQDDVKLHDLKALKLSEAGDYSLPHFVGHEMGEPYYSQLTAAGLLDLNTDYRGLVLAGAITEDKDERPLNHFYLPIDDSHGMPLRPTLSAPPRRMIGPLFNTDAVNWAFDDLGNTYGWNTALSDLYDGLTNRCPEDRLRSLARAFYDLGHIIHLLQDMTQPGHVRNNAHGWIGLHGYNPFVGIRDTSPFEVYFQEHSDLVRGILATYGPGLVVSNVPWLSTPKEFFYKNAIYTAVNFFSEDTIRDCRCCCADNACHPAVCRSCCLGLTCCDDECDVSSNFCWSADYPPTFSPPLALARSQSTSSWYVKNVNVSDSSAGNVARIERALRGSSPYELALDSARPDGDHAVLMSNGTALFPRAVLASAGLLDYFFRARLSVTIDTHGVPPPLPGGYLAVTYHITNVSAPAPQGADATMYKDAVTLHLNTSCENCALLRLFAERADGTRFGPLVITVQSNDTLAPGEEVSLTAEYPSSAALDDGSHMRCDLRTVIVFDGMIGSERGIAAAIADTGSGPCGDTCPLPSRSSAGISPCGATRVSTSAQPSTPRAIGRIAASTGDPGILAIDRYPSINDYGMVAFTGRDTNGSGAFVADPADDLPKRVTFFSPVRTFSGASITGTTAGTSELATQEQCDPLSNCGGLPYYAVRRWAADGSRSYTLIGESPGDFDSTAGTIVANNVDINSSGVVAFPAVKDGGTELFAGALQPPTNLTPGAGVNLGNIKPSISDTNGIVIRSKLGSIVIYADPSATVRRVAGPADGFTSLGLSPAISPNGTIVAFAGVLDATHAIAYGITPGEGVFAAIDRTNHWEYHRLAGKSGNQYLDPGETCIERNNDNNVCDLNPNDPAHSDIDQGLVASFLMDERLGVNDRGKVVFLAISTENLKGLYTNYLNLVNDPIDVGNPGIVVKKLDELIGSEGEDLGPIEDLSIYKPLSNTCPAQVVYWAGLGETDSAIVVSTVP
ncbi:MAG: hypothetical protein HY287_03870 [Planctomycetes bacterium]|nr:hypothetical protein [Planctomycetota bacterium]MBI3833450.1 hypothetical protein [Planctomycetota bacterium]